MLLLSMENAFVKHGCFAPHVKAVNEKSRRFLLLTLATIALGGCVTTDNTSPLAPSPPEVGTSISQHNDIALASANAFAPQSLQTVTFLNGNAQTLVPQQSGPVDIGLDPMLYSDGPLALSDDEKPEKCMIHHRFDRDSVLAYEWDRKRLDFDVDGLNMDGDGIDAVKLEYTLYLQPKKKDKRSHCRYKSQWQGLIGTGYNEFFIRKEDTFWDEIRSLRQEINGIF